MLFTYAQLSPGGREGRKRKGRKDEESHEEAEQREREREREERRKVHHVASERKRERLR